MNKADVIVIGGGVIGASAAYQLVKRGAHVLLLDKSGLAAGASGACDQAVLLQSKNPGFHLELARASLALYQTLEDELAYDLQYHQRGGMIVVETEEQLPLMQDFVQRQQRAGLQVELVSGDEARRRQPALASHVVAATWSGEDAQVNPLRLTYGYGQAARRLGLRWQFGVEARQLLAQGGRVVGVATGQGNFYADNVVVAAGPQTPLLTKTIGYEVPIRPRRGQIVITEPVPPLVNGDVLCSRYLAAKLQPGSAAAQSDASRFGIGLSLGQAAAGNLFIGGSREFVGYNTATTAPVLRAILAHALRLVPALAGIRAIRTMAGLRPHTPDSLPLIGPVAAHPGLFIAAGHEGDGIALAPITGALVADMLLGDPAALLGRDLSPDRFSAAASSF